MRPPGGRGRGPARNAARARPDRDVFDITSGDGGVQDRRSVSIRTHLVHLRPPYLGTWGTGGRNRKPGQTTQRVKMSPQHGSVRSTLHSPEEVWGTAHVHGARSCQAINRSPEPPVAPSHQD
ncbi:hypothetical protein GCM10009727_79750 [Actinomadura napierensis]|uniref:Uncharacterized protein n=1 Tax=Actinomadura napierensis TaxID=267854 RepID=A0ABP5M421_9ACTN